MSGEISSLVTIWKTSDDVWRHILILSPDSLSTLTSKGQMSLPTLHITPISPPTFASSALQLAVAPVHSSASAVIGAPFCPAARHHLKLLQWFCLIVSVYLYSWKLELLGWTQSWYSRRNLRHPQTNYLLTNANKWGFCFLKKKKKSLGVTPLLNSLITGGINMTK